MYSEWDAGSASTDRDGNVGKAAIAIAQKTRRALRKMSVQFVWRWTELGTLSERRSSIEEPMLADRRIG